jgi:hypothetical protein
MLRPEQNLAGIETSPPENWKCDHGHSGFEHPRCWDRRISSIVVEEQILKGWSQDEVKLLLAYRNPNKRLFQIKDDLWKKYRVNRSMPEVMSALHKLGINRELPSLKVVVGDIEATSLNANFGIMIGYEMKELCPHDQALGKKCNCKKPGRGTITLNEIRKQYGDAYVPEAVARERQNGHVCHCKEVFREAWITEKDTKFDKKLGIRPKDLHVVKKFLADLKDVDVFIGHNVRRKKGFDLRFVKARALVYARLGLISDEEMRPLNYGVLRYIDTLTDAWDNLAITSARQEVLISTFHTGIKTKLDEEAWNEAVYASPKAIDYIRTHCKTDVNACEVNAWLLKPFSNQWPYGRPV